MRFFVGDAAARGVTFLVLILSARFLRPQAYGDFSFAYGLVAVALLVSDLGLTPMMLRRLSRRRRVDPVAFWSATATNVVLGAVISGVLSLISFPFLGGRATTIAIYGLVLVVQGFATSVDAVLLACGRAAILGLARLLGNCVLAAAAGVALVVDPSATALAAAFVVGGCAKLGLGAFFAKDVIRRGRVRPRLARRMVIRAAPFAAAAVVSFLYFRVDVILLGVLTNSRSVGEYAAAYRIVDGLILLPGALAYTFFPHWIRSHAEPRELARLARLLTVTSIIVACAVYAWRSSLIEACYGRSYQAAAGVLGILVAALPLLFIDVVAVWLAYAQGRERAVVAIGTTALVANLALNFALIPRFGIRGAAWATVISEAVNLFGYAWIFRPLLRRQRRIVIAEVVVTGLVTTFAAVALTQTLVPRTAAVVSFLAATTAVAAFGLPGGRRREHGVGVAPQ